MCLAVPAKIVKISDDGNHAVVDYGEATKRETNISLVDAKKGDYVLIHAGFAIQVLQEEDAKKTLAMFKGMLSKGPEV